MGKYFRRMGVAKFIVFLVISIVLSVIVPSLVIGLSGSDPMFILKNGGLTIFLTSLVMYLSMMVLYYFFGLERLEREALFTKAPSRSVPNILYYFAPFSLGILLNLVYMNIIQRVFPGFFEQMMDSGNLSSNILKSNDPIQITMIFIAIVIMAPIVEEIVFRGILYNMLNKSMGLFAAAIVSSMGFGILHGLTFVQTFFIGLILAILYQITGDLKVPIIAHMVNNFIALVESILTGAGIIVLGGTSEIVYTVVLVALSLGVLVASIIYLRKNPLKKIFKDIAPIYKTEYFNDDEQDHAIEGVQ
ncbi:MAG: CPBP family intramembrane metalloprotease [Clostridiaceae bacterium]